MDHLLASVLDASIPNAWWVDLCRIFAIGFGGVICASVAFFLRDWKCSRQGMPQKARYIALFMYGFLSVLQEVQQIGKPLVLWRLPLIILASLIAIYGMYGEGWQNYFRARPEKPIEHVEWPETFHRK